MISTAVGTLVCHSHVVVFQGSGVPPPPLPPPLSPLLSPHRLAHADSLVRDPRWGRNQEVPSEAPVHTAAYVAGFSRGMQEGADPRYLQAGSTAKHFLVCMCVLPKHLVVEVGCV